MFAFLSGYQAATSEDYDAYLNAFFPGGAEEIQQVYPVDGETSPFDAISAIIGDTWFQLGTRWFARGLSDQGLDTWRYVFERELPTAGFVGVELGAYHGAEIHYVFHGPKGLGFGGGIDDEDQELLATFSKAAATIISAHPMFYKHEAKEKKEAAVALGNLDAAAVRLTATLD